MGTIHGIPAKCSGCYHSLARLIALVSGAGGASCAPITAPVGVLVEISLHVRRHHSSRCAHFLLEYAPHQLKQLGSHCSCSLSRSRLSRDASLFLSAAFSLSLSLSADLSVGSLSAALSLPALSVTYSAPLSRSLNVVLRRSITFYIGFYIY